MKSLPLAVVIFMSCVSAMPVQAQTPVAGEGTVDLGLGPAPVTITDHQGSVNNLFEDGRVFIAGQPDETALKAFAAEGVTAVVNLRTPDEMADPEQAGFDEAAVVAAAGMDYVAIPVGGEEYPYRTEVVDRLASVLESHPGPVVVHCRSAHRASYVWVAYLVDKQGLSLDDAIARGEQMRLQPSPLEGLLGRDLHLDYVAVSK